MFSPQLRNDVKSLVFSFGNNLWAKPIDIHDLGTTWWGLSWWLIKGTLVV